MSQAKIANWVIAQQMETYGRKTLVRDGQKMNIPEHFGITGDETRIVGFKALDQGSETYLEGHSVPVRGCFQTDRGTLVAIVKRLIPTVLGTAKGGIAKKSVATMHFLMSWKRYLDFMHYGLQDAFYPDPKYFQQPVAELYRVMSGYSPTVDKFRDVACAIMEFDEAYRYPVQDILSAMDKKSLRENPIKEIERLLKLHYERNGDPNHGLGKLHVIDGVLIGTLKQSKRLLEATVALLDGINQEKIALNEQDRYWTKQANFSYSFGS
ncbi:MAG: hypothetical protein KGL39_45985 [Patescibacteria group bacterium]|nr:hypothetical protein [Patescibacteria group bacterium]